MSKTLLVTGGAGFIGSHTVVELIQAGHRPIIFDNLSNSKREAVRRVERITETPVTFIEADIRDEQALTAALSQNRCDAVIHFAGLKAVGESVSQPLGYYDNNVQGTLCLLRAMQAANCRSLVFSSSATVYGASDAVPIKETEPIAPTNPYGATKAMIEQICRDLAVSDDRWTIALLRYFNPVGAHESGLIGEDPAGVPNNLMPYVSQVAVGKLQRLTVHGSDYPTRDGTGERDYIHVVDLARGHLAALEHLDALKGAVPINLGTGRGSTVLEVIAAFEKASGKQVPYQNGPRRPGDVGRSFAQAEVAANLLKWRAQFDMDRMCQDAWRWQSKNPNGFE